MIVVVTNGIPCKCPFCGNELPLPRNSHRKGFQEGASYQCNDCNAWFIYAPENEIIEEAIEHSYDLGKWIKTE